MLCIDLNMTVAAFRSAAHDIRCGRDWQSTKCHQDPQPQLTHDTARDCRPHLPKHLKKTMVVTVILKHIRGCDRLVCLPQLETIYTPRAQSYPGFDEEIDLFF